MKVFFLFVSICCCVLTLSAQDARPVQLKQGHIAYAPKNFYVYDVVDDRENKGIVGSIRGGDRGGDFNLQNGAAAAIKGFIAGNVTQDKTTQGVVVHISKLNFNIKKPGADWQEDADVVLTFYIAGKNLIELSGKGSRTTGDDPMSFIDEFVRKTVENDLKKFDGWWEQNRDRVPLSSTVKVVATIGKIPKKPNCIAYSLQRPLAISDFTGPVEPNIIELAATLSGTGMESSGQTVKGQLVLSIVITPYFDRSMSWFKDAGNKQQVLAHEQAHFDITAINACELVSRINNTVFTQENYEQKLQELLSENNDVTGKEQAKYDEETNHGTIRDKQLEWETKTKERIRAVGCY